MSITQNGWTPVVTAARYGKCDVVLDLLDSGADVNTLDNVSHCHRRLEPFLDMYIYMLGRSQDFGNEGGGGGK